MLIEPRSSDRAILVGMTGSGKTFLAGVLLRGVRRLVVLDPKGMLRGEWGLEEWSDDARERLLDGRSPVRVRVPAPVLRNSSRSPSQNPWDRYLWDIYDGGNVLLYIDEVYGVVPIGARAPDSLNAIYTRGRELQIGAYGATQRPSWIPLELLSECEWFFMFTVQLQQDRDRMAGLMGPLVKDPVPDEHGFWTYRAGWPEPIYTQQLVVETRRAAREGA